MVATSLPGSWDSSVDAPTSPSFAAAQGTEPYAVQPLAEPGAEVPLEAAFNQASAIAVGKAGFEGTFDWVHAFRLSTATTPYPIWNKKDPGLVTSLVFDASDVGM